MVNTLEIDFHFKLIGFGLLDFALLCLASASIWPHTNSEGYGEINCICDVGREWERFEQFF